MTGDEIQVHSGNVPEEAEPDEKPHIPAQQNELRNG
jgi:hypothetical protein